MTCRLRQTVWCALWAVVALPGCTLAPKSFVQSDDPAPLVRARALGMGNNVPDRYRMPALIAKLDDPDAVVRMTAIEELRRRTGQDLGYQPYADDAERRASVAAWKSWWQRQQNAALASPQQPVPRVNRTHLRRRGLFGRRY